MPPEGFADSVVKQWDQIPPEHPVSELIRHVIRATEANDTAPIPPNCEELWTG